VHNVFEPVTLFLWIAAANRRSLTASSFFPGYRPYAPGIGDTVAGTVKREASVKYSACHLDPNAPDVQFAGRKGIDTNEITLRGSRSSLPTLVEF